MKKIYLYAVLVWFIFAIIAIINGSIRVYGYQNFLGELLSHQISTIIFSIAIFLVTYIFLKKSENYKEKDLILIGIIWVFATILFEFIFGHYIIGHSWEKLFADYNILQGRIWSIVLIVTGIAPYVTGKFLIKN